MLVHHVTFLNGILKKMYQPFSKCSQDFHTLCSSLRFIFNADIIPKKRITQYIPPNHSMASADRSCLQNKTQKGHLRSQCLISDIVLPDAESGGSCPTFPRTLRRFPLKNACQGPRAETTRARMEGAEQSNPSLHYSLSFSCSNLFHVPDGEKEAHQGAPPTPQSWSDTHKE